MPRVKGWGVLLRASVPTEFLEAFSAYLHKTPAGLQYFLSSEVHNSYPFVGLALVQKGLEKDWEVQIPSEFVLAITELSDPEIPIGFH